MNYDELNNQPDRSDIPQEISSEAESTEPESAAENGEHTESAETPTAENAENGKQPTDSLPPSAASCSPTEPPQKKPPKKDHSLAIILGVLAVFALVFCIIIFGTLFMIAHFFINVNNSDPNSAETSQTITVSPDESEEHSVAAPSDGGETPRYENEYDINDWVNEEDLNHEQPIVNVVAKCTPSVVTVKTDGGSGSGVIWTTDGYIVTNNHVVEGYKNAVVTLVNGSEYPAVVLATDASNDLALLRIAVTGLLPADLRAEDDDILVGETIVAIGNPLGTLANSVTKGIVSALNRQITVNGVKMTLTQIDASVNPGNSGGGCFDIYGRLIGIVNAKSVDEDVEGLGYAIPLSTVKKVIAEMMENDTTTVRKSLGIVGIFVTEEEYNNLKAENGMKELLSAYEEKNGAPLYGILVTDDKQTVYTNVNNPFMTGTGTVSGQYRSYTYDLITAINGTAVTSAEQLNSLLEEQYKAGDVIKAEVSRISMKYGTGYFGNTGYIGCSKIEKVTVELRVVEMYR